MPDEDPVMKGLVRAMTTTIWKTPALAGKYAAIAFIAALVAVALCFSCPIEAQAASLQAGGIKAADSAMYKAKYQRKFLRKQEIL